MIHIKQGNTKSFVRIRKNRDSNWDPGAADSATSTLSKQEGVLRIDRKNRDKEITLFYDPVLLSLEDAVRLAATALDESEQGRDAGEKRRTVAFSSPERDGVRSAVTA